MQGSDGSAAPGVELELCGSFVGFDAGIWQEAPPAVDPAIGARVQATLGQQSASFDASQATGRVDLRVSRAIEVQADGPRASPIERASLGGERELVD
ncbi:hypothetical protein WL96_15650 (plasmid) [Burkholderia vietnamiensis]|nr:hypothetical protein WL96_15650 [Burkholderia vietnamiensis]